jgi:hypothetical protein
VSESRVPIRCSAFWTPVLVVCGMPPRAAYLEIGPASVRVRMGVGFRAEFPRATVRSPRRFPNRISIGVHGGRGGWLVNGAHGPLVAFGLDPPSHARVCGFPVQLRELVVSVDDPDALIAQLNP